MASEGAREIEAAKRLLAAAKLQVKSSEEGRNNAAETVRAQQKSLDVARKGLMAAQSQLSRSQQEVKDAEKFLAESEKRWEVISIDIADDVSTNNNNKRRKVSLSPQTNNDAPKTPKTRTKWQCDYCKDAYCTFDYDDCLRHENECRDKLRKAFYKIMKEYNSLDEKVGDDEHTKLVRKGIRDIVMKENEPTSEGVQIAIQNYLGIDLSQKMHVVYSIIFQSHCKKIQARIGMPGS